MAVSKKKATKIAKGYDKIVLPLEKRFKLTMERLFVRQAKSIKEAFLKHRKEKKADDDGLSDDEAEAQAIEISTAIAYAVDQFEQIIFKECLPLWINAAELGNTFFNNIQFTNGQGVLFSVFRDDYMKFLNKYGADMVVRVNRTTKDLTKKIIADGLKNGDSIKTIADNLEKQIAEYGKARAQRITVTEVHNSFQKGNYMSAENSGFKYKTWITVGDGSVRSAHQVLNGRRIKMDKAFTTGLYFPGDSRAPAFEVINCRCHLFYD